MLEDENQILEYEISQVYESNLGEIFIRQLASKPEYRSLDFENDSNENNFNKIFDKLNNNVIKQSLKKNTFNFNTTASQVSGSNMNKAVKF